MQKDGHAILACHGLLLYVNSRCTDVIVIIELAVDAMFSPVFVHVLVDVSGVVGGGR